MKEELGGISAEELILLLLLSFEMTDTSMTSSAFDSSIGLSDWLLLWSSRGQHSVVVVVVVENSLGGEISILMSPLRDKGTNKHRQDVARLFCSVHLMGRLSNIRTHIS